MIIRTLAVAALLAANLPIATAYDAAMRRSDTAVHLFVVASYLRFDLVTWRGVPGYPRPVDEQRWPGLPEGTVDAAVNWGNDKAYLFRDDLYFRYDLARGRMDDGYPRRIDDRAWPGLTFSHVDAVINWGNGKAYFFAGDRYVRYDIAADRADPGYPKRIDEGTWPGLGFESVDAAFNDGTGKAWFFSGGQYVRYDIASDRADPGYPRAIDEESFPGAARLAVERWEGDHTDESECFDAIDITRSDADASGLAPAARARAEQFLLDAGAACGAGHYQVGDRLTTAFQRLVTRGGSADASTMLLGSWRSMDDPRVVLVHDGAWRMERYDQAVVSDAGYRVAGDCDGEVPGETHVVTDDDFCFVIVELDADRLALTMVGGRGNTLRFERGSP